MLAAPALPAFTSEAEAAGTSMRELECLATAIYVAARGESEQGQLAVAQVILNRMASGRYPGTICGVVFQNDHRRNACQFSFACDGLPETKSDQRAWQRAQDLAERAVDGRDLVTSVKSATHYHASYVNPYWAPAMSRVASVGSHIFYKE